MKQLQNVLNSYCWRGCGNSLADHFHIFWDCVIIRPYSLGVLTEIKSIIGLKINHDFSTIYLGNISTKLNSRDKYLLQILLAASKKAITRKWMIKEPPTKLEWIGIVKEIYSMERLTFSLKLCMDKFANYWMKWFTTCQYSRGLTKT